MKQLGSKLGKGGCISACGVLALAFFFYGITTPLTARAQCAGGTPDGTVVSSEPCDDGNLTNGDGCSSACAIEPNFSCQRVLTFGGPNFVIEEYNGGTTSNWNADADLLGGVQTENAAQPSIVRFGEDAMLGTYVFDLGVSPGSGDNDFFGFVVGFNPGDSTNASAQFLMVDWKQATQTLSGGRTGLVGMALSVVNGLMVNTSGHGNDFWTHTGAVTELQRANTLASTGWTDPRLYRFEVTYRSDRLIVSVDGEIQFDVRPSDFPAAFPGGTFPNGQIGFETLSQDNVRADNIGTFGPSVCNTTSIADATIWRVTGDGPVTVDVASFQTDPEGDGLAGDTVLVTSSPAGATVTDPASGSASGMIDVSPTDTSIPANYSVGYTACDDNSDVGHCDTATVTVTYNDPPTVGAPTPDVVGGSTTITPAQVQSASTVNVVDGGWDNSSLSVGASAGGPYGTGAVASAQGGTCEISGGNVVYTEPASPSGATDSCFLRFCELNPGPAGIGATGRACDTVEVFFTLDSDGDGIFNSVEGTDDPDGDGFANYLDIDADGDGITDDVEGLAAPDTDAVPAYLDDDSDDDGVPDSVEGHDANMDGVTDRTPVGNDADGDGLDDRFDPDCPASPGCGGVTGVAAPTQNSGGAAAPDYLDADDDGDGIPTLVDGTGNFDGAGGPNYLDTDADGDGIADAVECPAQPCRNSDSDGHVDFLDLDDDGDGVLTSVEALSDPDGDGPAYLDTDSDGDGIGDGIEAFDANHDGLPDTTASGSDTNNNGIDDAFEGAGMAPLPDQDGSGGPDFLDVDSDGDGINDAVECPTLACRDTDSDSIPDYLDMDADGDGIFDAVEGLANPDGDTLPAYRDTDSDGDSVLDSVEGFDANADGSPDRTPSGVDLDRNGVDDAFDAAPAPTPNFDGSGPVDFLDPDDDGDGVPTINEGTGDLDGSGNPNYLDTDADGDGFGDAVECPSLPCRNSDTDSNLDFLDVDDDGDGILTSVEGSADPDGDGPAYLDTDSDGDGIPDSIEGFDADHDGVPDTTASGVDANSNGIDDAFEDAGMAPLPDQDGTGGPDYLDADSDGDGIDDAVECPSLACRDTDTDGIPDYLDMDSDGDGITDLVEGTVDPDGDTLPAYRDTDADGDGVDDAVEGFDADADGVADAGPSGADTNRNGVDDAFDALAAPVPNRDSDANPDFLDPDDDGDGLPTSDERGLGDADGADGPNYLDADDDGDGIPTSVECTTGSHATCEQSDSDGSPDYLDTDSDGDSLTDAMECPSLACPNDDGDSLADYRDPDDDGDGIDTTREIADQGIYGMPDGDTTNAWLDDDSDGDGVPDSTEGLLDIDMDGVPDYMDPDSSPVDTDDDGIPDTIECGGAPMSGCPDTDGDGELDYLDDDDDGDGIPTADECSVVTACEDRDSDGNPDWRDTDDDGDGIPTLTEGPIDTDGDMTPDYLDEDSDNDMIGDAIEAHDGDADGAPDAPPAGVDTDDDGLDDAYDPDCATAADCGGVIGMVAAFPDADMDGELDHHDIDADGDGIPDSVECTAMVCVDTDTDGTPDYLDLDSDGDGVVDAIEGHDANGDGVADVEAVSADSDGDGLDDAFDPSCAAVDDCGGVIGTAAPTPDRDTDGAPDFQDSDDDGDSIDTATEIAEEATHGDPDADGTPAYLDTDSDDDGSEDLTEAGLDLDGDGVPDYLDPNSFPTDSDDDGIPDVLECADLSMPASCPDTDGDGTPNFQDPDDDGDGVPTRDERPEGDRDTDGDGSFDHLDPDDDGDGLDTADECPEPASCRDTDGDGTPDFVDTDDDNDGIPTADEIGDGMLHGEDVDGDGDPNWLDTDSDGDSMLDAMECPDASAGCPDEDEDGVPDYLDAGSTADDTDGDGVPDLMECDDPSMPASCPDTDGDGTPDFQDPDDDGDGILTEHEVARGDTDGDGRLDYLDSDDDNDGVLTRFEAPDANEDGNPADARDTDADGTPDYLDTDDDNDGVLTRAEGADPNNDGDPADALDLDGDEMPSYLDADEQVDNPGIAGGALCSASQGPGSGSGAAWILLVLGALFLRRRRRLGALVGLLVVGGVLASAPIASAQQIMLDRYQASERTLDGFAISRPDDQGHLRFGAQLHLDYARNPLVLESMQGDAGTEVFSIVSDQFVGHLNVSLGLVDRVVVYGGVPINFVMDGEDTFGALTSDGAGLGDFFVGGRVRLLGEADDLFGLALQAAVTFPTADVADGGENFAGESGVTFHPEALFELRPGGIRITGNLGARIRGDETFGNVQVGHELTYGLGVTIPLLDDNYRLDGHIEAYGATTFENFGGREESPLEAIAGLKLHTPHGITAGLAAGPGFLRGIGSPDVRVVGMVGWAMAEEQDPEPTLEPASVPDDTDGDGLIDAEDECPSEPEDSDGFEDENGCPDPDNDNDGVLDVDDGAPMQPEDQDGFEDRDGVPDPDNDGDGVLDESDDCPAEAGVIENRGCADSDRDGDSVVDRSDNCPDEPGTVENHGCQEQQQVVIREGRLEILDNVYFRTNRDAIQRRSHTLLQNVAQVLNNHPEITLVRVEGHTDARGRHQYNVDLSQRRAEAVVRFLVRNGVNASRLEARGFGPDQPIVENAQTAEEHAQNRRVEFNIIGSTDGISQQDSGPAADTIDR